MFRIAQTRVSKQVGIGEFHSASFPILLMAGFQKWRKNDRHAAERALKGEVG